ncbi:hypothetical protein MMC30_004667 [Trapelia coarctata]|nr:hypothetical protein [Trapelia coarctata]
MVYYIRFLKPPKFVAAKPRESPTAYAVIAVTSDLGDYFYAGHLNLIVSVEKDGDFSGETAIALSWKDGMRALPFNIPLGDGTDDFESRRLHVSVSQYGVVADHLSLNELPGIVSGWSAKFDSYDAKQAERKLERRFRLDTWGGCELRMWEETGDSIARHIWDGGLGMVAYLRDITSSQSNATVPSEIAGLVSAQNPAQLSVLELGCGCGMVGIALAQMRPRCDVLLTDLPEAMEILELNVSVAQPAEGSGIRKAKLDWADDIPSDIREKAFDVILVSECTYNSDSIPALVETLSSLLLLSPEARVLLSTKVRHSSEEFFFDLMSGAGFIELEHNSVELPDRIRSERGESLETTEIYVFRHKMTGLPP